jgi:hypothetical protein
MAQAIELAAFNNWMFDNTSKDKVGELPESHSPELMK